MDLNALAIFVSVAEAGSFTAGAEALGLPKGSVSRKVSRLEAALGVRLLHRSTRKISLTDIGRDYYEQCRRGLAEFDAADRLISETRSAPSGNLRISAPVDFARGGLADWVAKYLTHNERTSVELVLSDHYVDLIDQRIDLAFRTGLLRDSSFIARKLGSARRVLCASPDYLERNGTPQTVSELQRHQCIIHGTSISANSWRLSGPEGEVFVPVKARVAGDSMSFASHAAQSGLGIALLPEAIVRAQTQSGTLTRVLQPYATVGQGLYAIYPSNRQLSANVRAFLDIVIEETKHWPSYDDAAD